MTGVCTGNTAAGLAAAAALGGTASCLKADAGSPYSATRAGQVTLNGGKPRDASGQPIAGYQWSWQPAAGCPDKLQLASEHSATLKKPTLTFTVLCGLSVTLTVTGKDGHTAKSHPVTVTVEPRKSGFDKTPVNDTSDDNGDDTKDLPEAPAAAPVGVGPIPAGRNVSTCQNRVSLNEILCPAPSRKPALRILPGRLPCRDCARQDKRTVPRIRVRLRYDIHGTAERHH